MYDFQHPLSDSIEGVTHSLCSLEYEIHRPLYDWFLEQLGIFHSRQIEFARLNLTHTVLSKRWLLELVKEGRVSGWDDPRMPTLVGLRRRGYTPESLRDFAARIGVSKADSTVDIALLEHCLREDLNRKCRRVMAVLRPLKLVIENWPRGKVEKLDAVNNPEDSAAGTRKVPFSGELFIEQDDFREVPPPKYYRLSPGQQVRLRYGYIVTCTGVKKDPSSGAVEEVRCTYDPSTRGRERAGQPQGESDNSLGVRSARAYRGSPPVRPSLPGRISPGGAARHGLEEHDQPFLPGGCERRPPGARASRSRPGERFQFERLGYFCVDPDSTGEKLVFNRTVTLKDTWARIEKRALTA